MRIIENCLFDGWVVIYMQFKGNKEHRSYRQMPMYDLIKFYEKNSILRFNQSKEVDEIISERLISSMEFLLMVLYLPRNK